MKSFIIKMVGVVLMGITVMNLFACTAVKTDVVEETKKQLQEKYNADFGITSIGNRINTGSATMYGYRIGNENELFEVVYSHETKNIEEYYVKSKISYEIANDLRSLCNEKNINICGSVLLTCDESSSEVNVDMSIPEFLEKYNVSIIAIRVCLDTSSIDTNQCEMFLGALQQLSSKYTKKINVILYPMNEENYLTCSNEIKEQASPSTKWFMDYSNGKEIIISAENNVTTMGAKELESSIKGD